LRAWLFTMHNVFINRCARRRQRVQFDNVEMPATPRIGGRHRSAGAGAVAGDQREVLLMVTVGTSAMPMCVTGVPVGNHVHRRARAPAAQAMEAREPSRRVRR
jgi:hypothetical protein